MEEEILLPPPPKKQQPLQKASQEEVTLLPPPPKKNQGEEPQTPLTDLVTSLGKTVYSGITDELPKMFYSLQQNTASQRAQDAAQGKIDPVDFQRFVREKKGIPFYYPFSAEDHQDMIEPYKQTLMDMSRKESGITDRKSPVQLEREIQQQKEEAAKKIGPEIVTNISDIKNASGLASYVGHMVGQGVYQIPTSIASGGTSSFLMESAIVYDTQLDLLAEKYGISREEVIKRGLDKPAIGQAFAGAAGALDAFSAGAVSNLFRKSATGGLTKELLKDFLTEASTEAAQGNIERYAASKGAGVKFDPLSASNINETINEFIGGGIGGSAISLATGGTKTQPKQEVGTVEAEAPKEIVKEATQVTEAIQTAATEVSTGDAVVDAAVDQEFSALSSEIDAILENERFDDWTANAAQLKEDAKNLNTYIDGLEAKAAVEEVVPNSYNELNEIHPNAQLTPQEVTDLQAEVNVRLNRNNDMMLDDSVQTPALDARVAQQQPVVEQTTAPAINEITEEDYYGERNENLPLPPKKAVVAEPPVATKPIATPEKEAAKQARILEKQKKLDDKKQRLFEARERSLKSGTYKPAKKVEMYEKLIKDTEEFNPEMSKRLDKALQDFRDQQDDKTYQRALSVNNPTERIAKIKNNLSEDFIDEHELLDTANNINWLIDNEPTNLDAIETSISQLPDLKEQVEASENFTEVERASFNKTIDEIRTKGDTLLAERNQQKAEEQKKTKEQKKKLTGDKDSYLTSVASSIDKNDEDAIAKSVQEYKDFRAQEGLKPMSTDEILKKAQAPHYQAIVRNSKKEKTASEKQYPDINEVLNSKTIKALGLKDLSGNITPILGIKDSNISRDYENQFDNIRKADSKEVTDNIEKYYTEWFGEVGGKSMANVASNIFKLGAAVQNAVSGKPIEIYYGDATSNVLGFHYYEGTTGRNILLLPSNKYTGSTELHEVMHLYQAAINQGAALLSSKSFSRRLVSKFSRKTNADRILEETQELYRNVNAIHKRFTQSLVRDFKDIAIKLTRNQPISSRETALIQSTILYIEEVTNRQGEYFGHMSEEQLVSLALRELSSRDQFGRRNSTTLYGTTLGVEMLAESLSNPYFASMMLHTSYSSTGAKVNVSKKSYLAELASTFLNYINTVLKDISLPGISTIDNTYFGELLTTLSDLEVSSQDEFLNSDNMEKLMDSYPATVQADIREAYGAAYSANDLSARKIGGTNKKIIYKLSNKFWKDINSFEETKQKIDDLNKSLKNKLGLEYATDLWSAISNNKKTLSDAKSLKTNIDKHIKTLPQYKTDKVYKRDADDFSVVNLDNLNLSDVRAYSKGYLELVNNGIPSKRSFDIVNRAVADKIFNEQLLPHAGKFTKGKGLFGLLNQAANPATYATVVSKYDTTVANSLMESVYSRVLEDTTNSERLSNPFLKKLHDIYNDETLVFRDSVRAHMLGTIRSTFKSPLDPEYWSEVKENIDWVIQSSKNKLAAFKAGRFKSQSEKSIELEVEVAEELGKIILEKKSFENILTKGQAKLLDTFSEFAKSIETETERNARGKWGSKEYIKQHNYHPTVAQGTLKTGDLNGKDDLVPNTNTNNLYDAVVSNQNYGNLRINQAGSSKLKTKPKNYFYDSDILSVAGKWAKPTVFDFHASRSVKIVNLLLNHNKKIFDVMEDSLVRNLNTQIRSIVGASGHNIDDFGKVFNKILKGLDTYTTALIATTGQFLTQGSSIVSAITIVPPKAVGKALKAMSGLERKTENFSTLHNWLEEHGMGIQYRDALFYNIRHIHGSNSTQLKRVASRVKDTAEDITRFAFTQTDKYAARLVWFSAYFNAGGTLEKPTRAAVLEAERMVGVLQNMNHASFSAPMFRASTGERRALVKALYGLKSFSLNSAINIYSSAQNLNKSPEARRVFVSHLAMTAAYHATLVYLTRPLYQAVASALFGDDDEDKDKKRYSKEEEIATNAIWDALIGQGSPTGVDGFLRWAYSETLAEKIHGSEDEKFDNYLDSPLFAERNVDAVKGESLGLFGDFYDMGGDLISWNTAYMNYMEDPSPENEAKLEEMTFLLGGNMIAFARHVPMRGDLKRLMNKHARNMKKERAAASKDKNVDNDGTVFEIETAQPELEFGLPELETNEN